MNCKLPMKPSRPDGLRDKAFNVFGFYPVRCHRCCDRLYRRKGKAAVARKRRHSRQKAEA